MRTSALAVIGGVLSLACFSAAPAVSDTISFSGLPTGTLPIGSSYVEGAYTIVVGFADPGDSTTVDDIGGTHGNVLVDGDPNDVFGSSTLIQRTDGGLFNVTSLDVANLDNGGTSSVHSGSGFRIEVSGAPSGDDVYGPGSSTFATVSPANLINLTQLQVNIVSSSPLSQLYAVDNIVLSPVATASEPTGVALVGAGLLGVFMVARRRTC